MSETILWTIIGSGVGVAAGGLITWWVSRRYYKEAGNDLKAEAAELRRATDRVLRFLEAQYQGIDVTTRLDDQGNIVGLNFRLGPESGLAGTVTMSGELTAQPRYGEFPSD
jgi:hypothetical protein